MTGGGPGRPVTPSASGRRRRGGGVVLRYYTLPVPTRHPRHAVTETPPVRAALDELRSRGIDFTLGELVVRGAEARLAESAQESARQELRARLAAALRDGTHGLDPAALDEARASGWTRLA